MNRTVKIAALVTALCLVSASLFGCNGNAEKAEYFELIKTSSEAAVALESGEILVHESITADVEIEGVNNSGNSETFIYFTNGEVPDFELRATTSIGVDGAAKQYELIKDGDTVLELVDGVGDFVSEKELPDIFANFRVDFELNDIKTVVVESELKGVKVYKLSMTKAYADEFDSEVDGVNTDCTDIAYSYYIDSRGTLQKVVCETASTVTVGGQSQSLVSVVDSAIA